MSLAVWRAEHRQLRGRISRLLDHAKEATDDELAAELSKYVCILYSGLVETRCREYASAFASKQAAPAVLRLVDARLRRFRRSSCQDIRALFRELDVERADQWFDGLSDEYRDAVDSIKNNRNQLAHGRNLGLSLGALMSYMERTDHAMVALEQQFPAS